MLGDPPGPRPLGRHNPRLAALRHAVRGEVPGLTVVDGTKLVLELVGRGIEPVEVYATPERLAELLVHPLLSRLAAAGRVFAVAAPGLERLAPTQHTQGVLATVPVPRRRVGGRGVTLYLDRIQDPGNVGAVIRCAAAFGAAGVACSPGCGAPFSPKAIRASAGVALLLPVAGEADFEPLAKEVTAAGGEVAAAVGGGGIQARTWRPRLPLLLVLGNEGQGPREETLGRCGSTVTLPLLGGVESLNVAVAAGVLLAALAGVVPSPILE